MLAGGHAGPGPAELFAGRPALGTEPEELDAMRVDEISRVRLDLARDGFHPVILDLGRPAAALADDVVVVSGLADDIGVIAVRQVQALHQTELLEQFERSKDGRPPDP
jgi:hypothetical protein